MGISDNSSHTYMRNTLLPCIWERSRHLSISWINQLQGGPPWQKKRNEEGMCLQLDLLDEVGTTVKQRIVRYQDLMAKHCNTKVKPRHFQVRDLILRKVTIATKDPVQGKLGPNWEGPYGIVDCHRNGTYHLETLDRKRLHHSWNTEHLWRCYQ